MNPFLKFLQSARNLAKNHDLSKEDVLKFAKNEFGDITGLMRAQIDQIFKPGKQAIKKQTDNIVSIKKDDIPKKAEGGIMRANYARGMDLEAGAQLITIEGDVSPNNMMMASESPEEEEKMLKDIELLQEMKEFEEFKKNNPGSTYDDFKASKLISTTSSSFGYFVFPIVMLSKAAYSSCVGTLSSSALEPSKSTEGFASSPPKPKSMPPPRSRPPPRPVSAPRPKSCSIKFSISSFNSLEYFSRIACSALRDATLFNSSASTIACSNIDDMW